MIVIKEKVYTHRSLEIKTTVSMRGHMGKHQCQPGDRKGKGESMAQGIYRNFCRRDKADQNKKFRIG